MPQNGNLRTMQLDSLLNMVYKLQAQLIDRDGAIHELNRNARQTQENNHKKQELKKGFAVIEERHVDTSSIDSVLKLSMRHMLYTLQEQFGGDAGVVLLDVPYNTPIGATNKDLKRHLPLRVFWTDRIATSAATRVELAALDRYRDIISHKKGKLFDAIDLGILHASAPILANEVGALMAVPIVVDNMSIALVLMVNGEFAAPDPKLVAEVLAELWTPSVQPLINLALDNQRKKETEMKLVQESMLRDEIILTLDTILDDVVKHALANTPQGRSTSEHLWRTILQRVANFFEEYFASDVLLAVTNTEANFRIQNIQTSTQGGSRKGSLQDLTGDLSFIHYVFSESLRHVRKTKMRELAHPSLQDAKLMRDTMASGEPYYTPNCKGLKLPCGHMKMNCLLLVPILFCEEPVGLLGLANGDFSMSSGRILQSVFTTFWSMIVKATIMSESQKVLNAALPVAISERIKKGNRIADLYPSATVLFADIVGFTEFTEDLEPIQVVEFSNLIFARLDELVKEYELEKIKVIGDCYMVAGGLQDKSGKNPQQVFDRCEQAQLKEIVNFGLRILEEAKKINEGGGSCSAKLREKLKKKPLQFRIGIGEGPLTAGVFGTTKAKYDVCGATVNLASRLESSGRAGAVQVSEAIQKELAKEGYTFERRKPIALKGLGMQQTFFVTSAPPSVVF